MDNAAFVDWFRAAGPYINAHRGRVCVLGFGGEAIADAKFDALIHDIALLHSLGLKLVLVHGARPQIEARLAQAAITPRYVAGLRITDSSALPLVKEAVGQARIAVEARLSMSMANSPMHGARLRVASGNFVIARPLGVRAGVDYCFTGEVRRVDTTAIRGWLDSGSLVLLSPLGYSPTGEVFNLAAEDVATATAAALRADKLMLLYEGADLMAAGGDLIRELGLAEAVRLSGEASQPEAVRRHLGQGLRACRAGVRRVHLLPRRQDGALLLELYTRDGVGTMLNADSYEGLRQATIDDVGGVVGLIQPLEEAGILVRRSRERLEVEIERFLVLERDEAIIGCAALYPFAAEQVAELACLAVASEYRNGGRADVLLRRTEELARQQGLQQLFVLTTRTAHWFQERGFRPAAVAELPVRRQALYNWQRASKVFIKSL